MDCSRWRTRRLAGLSLAAISMGGCATAQPRAWDEVARPSSEQYVAYDGEAVEEIHSVASSGTEFDFEQRAGAEYDVQYSIEAEASQSPRRRVAAPERLSDWGATTPEPAPEPRYAQADPPEPRGAGSRGTTTPAPAAPTRTDALPADTALLIYTAVLTVAVLHVDEQQDALQQLAESVGGYLARRNGELIVVRVPVRRFQEVLQATEAFGDVLARNVETEDVSEEFRDTTIRLRNLEVMRTRLEGLLNQADNVNDALAVEREMQRVTEEIERLRGRIRYLEDQISFSTITVNFRPRAPEITRVSEFRLPFRWLDRLGLPRLLEVR